LLFLSSSLMHSQTSSLPDAPSTQSQAREYIQGQIQEQIQAQTPQQTQTPSTPPLVAPDPHWLKVEQLPPGTAIAVVELGRDYPTSCTLNSVSDTTLACIQPIPYSPPRRLVFPMNNVAAVYIEEPRPSFSLTPFLVGAGIGGGMGAGLCKEGSARVILTCSLLGAGIGLGIGADVASGPSTVRHPPRIHRRLIYRAPPGNRD
jgi:hypothetical protein